MSELNNEKKPDIDFSEMFSSIFSTLYKNMSTTELNNNNAEINDNTTFGEMSEKIGNVISDAVNTSPKELTFEEMCDKLGDVTEKAVNNLDVSEVATKLFSVETTNDPNHDDTTKTTDEISNEISDETLNATKSDNTSSDNVSTNAATTDETQSMSNIINGLFDIKLSTNKDISEHLKNILPHVMDFANDFKLKFKAEQFFKEQLKTCTLSEAEEKTKLEFSLPDNTKFNLKVTVEY